MKTRFSRTLLICVMIVVLCLSVCGCEEGMKWHPVYDAALIGSVVGLVVGHQYDEDCQGAAIGAAVGAAGSYLKQYDELASVKDVVVEVASEDGSIVPVVLKKREGIYICPNGEHYNKLPGQEQLREVYGL
jgi:hypothetical protein